ncbi:four helix bundle protein [Candidatus Woesearchaeota archaeon]|nr:four helix bundle protein [Candidatus Woesearchaeota archaeon]HIH37374.1 four helix bundle protein [Candidatus Woesearchaeota archaeon]HIH48405.1 four helix bundle protein [Candidatus Woesearchaeota archaeon]HIJ04214.1 four helix bundle protein [Candidatus Woesearchaeota archaeon]
MGRNHETMEVYHLSYDFVLQIYKTTRDFPSFERGNFVSQINRASTSIPANIAEGTTKPTPKEFLYFLTIAYGSGKELEVLLSLAKDIGYIKEDRYLFLKEKLDELNAKMYKFIRYIEKQTPYKFYQSFEENQMR